VCECGKTHRVVPREALYARGAVAQLPAICARAVKGRRVAVLMDVRTRAVAGESAREALAAQGWTTTELLVPDLAGGAKSPICDDIVQKSLSAKLGEVDLLLPVGGGVITDLGRWLAEERKKPFVSFATAASMNGYTSANVSPTIQGVKSLLWAHPPLAVAADPDIIANAPSQLTGSGLGDVLAKSVSTTDWRLNHLLFGDYYCALSTNLIAGIEPLYLEHPEGLKARAPEAIDALFQALLLTGAAMTMTGTSSPASGAEHMVSHSLDMMSSLDGVEHDLHGRQVGMGTVLASEVYRRVLATESPEFVVQPATVDERFWGKLAGQIAQEYAGKAERLRRVREKLARKEAWDRLRAELAPLTRTPETVQRCLALGGGAANAEQIRCGKDRLLRALLHAHEMRSRFTIFDLARCIGILPNSAAEIVEKWG
jgi:glycerol-1-phosphate dehydrogenase [NAD(P)+]